MSTEKKLILETLGDGSASNFCENPSLPFINVVINGQYVVALLDTGATQSIITAKLLEKINKKHYLHSPQTLTLGDGKTSLQACGSILLNILVSNINTSTTVLIVKDLAADLILGCDWLQKYDVNILLSQQRISIKHCGYTYFTHLVTDYQLPLKLDSDYYIAPKRNRVVHLLAPNKDTTSRYFNAQNQHFQTRKRISIFNGTIDIH
jgi:predicted aspartyl protease